MTYIRPPSARRTTTCPDCAAEVGVQPEYNYTLSENGARPGSFRIAIHPFERVPKGPRCTGSRMFIDAFMVVEKKRSA